MEREAFLYVKAKLLNSSIANRKNFGSGEVHFNLTGTYMNDPFSFSCVVAVVVIFLSCVEPVGIPAQGKAQVAVGAGV